MTAADAAPRSECRRSGLSVLSFIPYVLSAVRGFLTIVRCQILDHDLSNVVLEDWI